MKLGNSINKSAKATSPGSPVRTLLLAALLALLVCLAAANADTMPNHYDCCIIGSDCVQSASCGTKNCYCDLSRGMHRDVAKSRPPPPKYDCCAIQGKCVNSTLCATHDCVCSPEDEDAGKVNVGFSPRMRDSRELVEGIVALNKEAGGGEGEDQGSVHKRAGSGGPSSHSRQTVADGREKRDDGCVGASCEGTSGGKGGNGAIGHGH